MGHHVELYTFVMSMLATTLGFRSCFPSDQKNKSFTACSKKTLIYIYIYIDESTHRKNQTKRHYPIVSDPRKCVCYLTNIVIHLYNTLQLHSSFRFDHRKKNINSLSNFRYFNLYLINIHVRSKLQCLGIIFLSAFLIRSSITIVMDITAFMFVCLFMVVHRCSLLHYYE